jgi:hypothetical protein
MPTVAGRKLHGQNGAVLIQGFAASASIPASLVNLAVKKWEGTLKYKDHDTSNTSVTQWETHQKGKGVLSFSIDAELDVSQLPTGVSGVDLQADYCSINLVQDQTSGSSTGSNTPGASSYGAQVAIITEIKITSAENDIIKYSLSGTSSGTVVINAGS